MYRNKADSVAKNKGNNSPKFRWKHDDSVRTSSLSASRTTDQRFLIRQDNTCDCCYLLQFINLQRNSQGESTPADSGSLRTCACSRFDLFHLYSLLSKSQKDAVLAIVLLASASSLRPSRYFHHICSLKTLSRRRHPHPKTYWRQWRRTGCFVWWIHSS